MNHNTARCSSCNAICQLPHLRARASAAKCEACARREAERVSSAAVPAQGMARNALRELVAKSAEDAVDCGRAMQALFNQDDDKWERRARELTEEKRRENFEVGDEVATGEHGDFSGTIERLYTGEAGEPGAWVRGEWLGQARCFPFPLRCLRLLSER